MLAVAIVSVVVSALVAIAAIGAAVWQQRQGFGHEREMADRASVRDSLAEAAAILNRAEYAIGEVNVAVIQHGSTIFDPEHPDRLEPLNRLRDAGKELDQAVGLLRVQLGPRSSATTALAEADAALLLAFRSANRLRYLGPDPKGAQVARIEDRNDQDTQLVDQGRENFKAAVERFVERAHAAAGAKLPADEDQPAPE